MRALFLCVLLLCLPLPGLAEPLPALRAAPDEPVLPGSPAWPLAPDFGGAGVRVILDETAPGPDDLPSFRLDLPGQALPGASPSSRACLGLGSALRRNLHKTRALEFRVRASRPVDGLVVLTSSNAEAPLLRDRFFGSFRIGAEWKSLRLPYAALAPLPGWGREAERLGFAPGDQVLRPDSVEDLCLGVDAGRLGLEPVTLWISGVRFAP